MRNLVLSSLLVMAAWLAGCSNSTTTINTNAVAFSNSSDFAYLEVGGLDIRAKGDTAVNFDLVPNTYITNDSNVALNIVAVWTLTLTLGDTVILTDTIDLGTIPPNGSVPIDSIPIVTFSQASLGGGQLAYRLSIRTIDGVALASESAVFGYIPFTSRFRGIIYTTESSPTPIAILDGPDNADWVGDSSFTPIIPYPNPATKTATLGFTTPESMDSVQGELHITPRHIIRTFTILHARAGTNEAQLDLTGIAPGLYRFVWLAYKNGTTVACHGDIMVSLQ